MPMTGFICQDKYLEQTKKLSDTELGRLFRACMMYHKDGIEPDLDGRESMAFDFIREDIDSADKAYDEKCEKNRRNRMTAVEQKHDDPEQTLTNDNERKQPSTNASNINKVNKNKNKDKENNNKRFTPPTLEEVTAYCQERGSGISAQHFIDYYQTRNWVLSNGKKMVDWKAAVRTWEGNEWNKKKTVPAQGYSQRDYSGEQDEAMQRMIKMMEGA